MEESVHFKPTGGGSFNPLSVYPIGSIYLSTNGTNPAELFGGTWESIGSGRVLQGADDTHAAGETIEAGLPNITGEMKSFYSEDAISEDMSGAFAGTNGETKVLGTAWGQTNNAIDFDASRCNAIYGRSNTVQPPAFVVNIWLRVA